MMKWDTIATALGLVIVFQASSLDWTFCFTSFQIKKVTYNGHLESANINLI